MIKYSTIPASKADEIAEFLLGSFFVEEPVGVALGLQISEVRRWYPGYIKKTLTEHDSISIMAVDSDTGKLIGVCVGFILDPANPPTYNMAGLIDSETEPTMAQIARILDKNWQENPSPPTEKTLIHQFLSVDSKYGGKGIAKQLIQLIEKRVVDHADVHQSMVDTTSHFSYRAYEKVGYQVILEREYASIEDGDGIKPLESKKEQMGVHTHLRLLFKRF